VRTDDIATLATQAVFAHRVRTALILIAMGIGVAAVILLTMLGETGRRYITGEFASLGTNLLIVLPGRNETTGGPPPLFGTTPRDLTVGDALALERSPYIKAVAPLMIGAATVSSAAGIERDSNVLGTTYAMQEVRDLTLAQGRFLPAIDPSSAASVCVIGETIRTELFPNRNPIGQWLRVGDRRFRIIGVLSDEGVSVGIDFNEMVLVPVASTQQLFNRESLFRILTEMRSATDIDAAIADVRRIITERHEGEDDVTIIIQDSIVSTFNRILSAVTYGIAGIGAISLAVAGILIMNVMLVSVVERTAEVGLLKALGSPSADIRRLFLVEAALLSLSGAVFGMVLGVSITEALKRVYPGVPFAIPTWAIIASVGVALLTGLFFGVLPARRAARLDPVLALSRR
jgi:putative ABC transport system permease protein